MKWYQKSIYVVLIIGLVLTENYALDKERATFANEEAHRRKEENEKLQSIVEGLKATIEQNQNHFDVTMSGLKDVVQTETGGNSFCYLDVFPVSPEKNAVNHAAAMGLTRVGKYPLHGITMTLDDKVPAASQTTPLRKNRRLASDSRCSCSSPRLR
jgi:hypothetical protein